MLLDEALDLYISVHPRIRSPRTIRSYRTVVAQLATLLSRPPTTEDLTDANAGALWRARQESVSTNTVNGEATTLLAMWRWLAMDGHCKAPRIQPPQRDQKAPQAMSREQIERLWQAAVECRGEIAGIESCRYWPALLYTSWDTGERIGAVLALEWRDVSLDEAFVRYPAHTRKGGRKELIRAVRTETVRRLEKLQQVSQHDRPFGVLNRSAWYTHWHALRIAAGLPEWCRPHTIRKSAASHLPTTEDAAELLGHRSARITRDHYRDPRIADGRRIVEKLPDPLPRRRRWWPWAG